MKVASIGGWLAASGMFVSLVSCGESTPHENLGREAERLVAPVQVSTFALLASGRATFRDRTVVSGGHVGVAPGTGDSVTAWFDSQIALGRSTLGQRVVLKDRARAGDLFAGAVVPGAGASFASLSPYAAPPSPPPIVPFTPGTGSLAVNTPTTLGAGSFGAVTVSSTLTLSGGIYQLQSLSLSNNAVVQAALPSIVRVAGKVTGGNNVRLVPTGLQNAGALRLIVAGATDATGGVVLGTDARLTALVVSRASVQAGDRFVGRGAIAARNLTFGIDAAFTFGVGFECNADASCDDGNACTADACVDAKCVHSALPDGTLCPDDGSVCTNDACASGVCAHPALPDGTACTSDDNECTSDACSAGACSHPPVAEGTACTDDGNDCTGDACSSGACAHPDAADGTLCASDDNECTGDACSSGACAHLALPDGSACADDGNTCTADACTGGSCTHALEPGLGSCAAADAVEPLLECVTPLGGGLFRAVFGYENDSGGVVHAEAGVGNGFLPAPSGRGQPEHFLPGSVAHAFATDFSEPSLTWFVGGHSAVATPGSPACPSDACAGGCPAGTPCVGGTCVPVCGDGVCSSGENCRTCSSECTCNRFLGEGSSPPSPEAAARILPQVPVAGASTGTLAPGFGLSGTSVTSGSLGAASAAPLAVVPASATPFVVRFTSIAIGNDASCFGGAPYVNVWVNGAYLGEQTLPLDCEGGGCDVGSDFDVSLGTDVVPFDDFGAQVRVRLNDADTTLCGGSDDVIFDHTFDVDNLGTVTQQTEGVGDEGAGWFLWWQTEGNGRPQICPRWWASFVDTVTEGLGFDQSEALLAGGEPQQVQAIAAVAEVTVTNGLVSQTYRGPLDGYGCVPTELSPETALWRLSSDPGPGNGLTITARWSSEFCMDPAEQGCLDGSGQRTQGARMLVHRDGEAEPRVNCVILTQDETLTEPDCRVIHQSEGAFETWDGFMNAPRTVVAVREAYSGEPVENVAAIVSTLYGRELDTGGDFGIVQGLAFRRKDGGTNLVDVNANGFCDFGGGVQDTCADTGVTIRPDACCLPGTIGCHRVASAAECLPDEIFIGADSRWKYVVSHEIGHVIQDKLFGTLASDYTNDAGPPKCRCAHVTGANSLHCLQGMEAASGAQVEGFAQFFASQSFNLVELGGDCVFHYYKEFLDDTCRPGVSAAGCTPVGGLVKSQPPQPFDCRAPQKWRNTHCAEGAMPGDPITRQGTELDWLGFYTAWRWGTGDPERDSNVVEFSDTYVEACGGVSCALPANVTFEATATTGSLRLAGLEVLGGASERIRSTSSSWTRPPNTA